MSTKPPRVAVMVRMPPAMKQRLQALARAERRSLSGQVLALLERALGPSK